MKHLSLACLLGLLALSGCREDGANSNEPSPATNGESGQNTPGGGSGGSTGATGGSSTGSITGGGNTSGGSNSSGGNLPGGGNSGGSSGSSGGSGSGGSPSNTNPNTGDSMSSTTEEVNVINFFQVSVEFPVITIQRDNGEIWNIEVPRSFEGPVTATATFINRSSVFGGANSTLRLEDDLTLRVLTARRIL